jgi:hypothetical protein
MDAKHHAQVEADEKTKKEELAKHEAELEKEKEKLAEEKKHSAELIKLEHERK